MLKCIFCINQPGSWKQRDRLEEAAGVAAGGRELPLRSVGLTLLVRVKSSPEVIIAPIRGLLGVKLVRVGEAPGWSEVHQKPKFEWPQARSVFLILTIPDAKYWALQSQVYRFGFVKKPFLWHFWGHLLQVRQLLGFPSLRSCPSWGGSSYHWLWSQQRWHPLAGFKQCWLNQISSNIASIGQILVVTGWADIGMVGLVDASRRTRLSLRGGGRAAQCVRILCLQSSYS